MTATPRPPVRAGRSSAPARSARKARGDGHLRRAEILAAAEEIFLSVGYEGATIRKIAEAVGVSSTALYVHFADRSEILVEICERAFARLLGQNTEIATLVQDPVQRVREMLEAYMRFALEEPNAYQLVFCSAARELGDARESALRALGRRCFSLFRDAFEDLARAGRLRGSDPEAAAQVAWTAAHGLVALLITRPNFEWREEGVLRELLLETVLEGLIRSGPRAPDGGGAGRVAPPALVLDAEEPA